MLTRCDVIRSDIMNFFRHDKDCVNIHSLSREDRYEIMLLLCEHSDILELAVQQAIENYEGIE